uniref:Uncharacterized protein n=1 Tax=Siphoviridae sp. ct2QJ10 TaxID=2825315 RepID=A0A8S5P7G4_9CAUD|nr:MAG TPA: hypothetical protein [Siphoviridae sp. ct2QJ10]
MSRIASEQVRNRWKSPEKEGLHLEKQGEEKKRCEIRQK